MHACNMQFAWYGASNKGVASILSHGFALPNKFSGSEAHGIGIYLSPLRLSHTRYHSYTCFNMYFIHCIVNSFLVIGNDY
ncbi:hypothetical protein CsSME_00035662 [Camellia sinensis var. sinensis]